MSFTISLSWWLAPLAVTIIAFVVAFAKDDRGPAGDYGGFAQAFASLLLYATAAIVSLIAWLIWALAA